MNVGKEIYFIASEALKILFTEPIVAFLGIYNGFAYGLLFLYLEVSPLEIISNGRVYGVCLPSTTASVL
jgi:hypothetical protein